MKDRLFNDRSTGIPVHDPMYQPVSEAVADTQKPLDHQHNFYCLETVVQVVFTIPNIVDKKQCVSIVRHKLHPLPSSRPCDGLRPGYARPMYRGVLSRKPLVRVA